MGRSDDHGLKKVEWVHVFRQLAQQQRNLEGSLFEAPRAHEGVKKELLHAKHEAAGWDADLAREANQMKAELSNQRHSLVNVTTLVNMVKRGMDSGDSLREELESLEETMVEFKKSRRRDFEEMSTEERLLTRELGVLTQHIESWGAANQAPAAAVPCPESKGSSDGEDSEDEEVVEEEGGAGLSLAQLEARVEALNHRIAREGGATGGWHPREHEMFVTVMTQTGAGKADVDASVLEAMVDRAAVVLRDRCETEVLEHRQWYMRYQRLAEEKKRAVKLWRTRRDAAREEAKRKEEADELPDAATRDAMGKRLAAEEKRREEQKKRVEAWREEKARKGREEEEAKVAREEEERRAEEERFRRKTARAKQEVELYRYEKERERRRKQEVEKLLHGEGAAEKKAAPTSPVDLQSRVKETLEKARQRREEAAKKDPQRLKQEREEKQKKLLESLRESPWDDGPRLLPRQAYRDPERIVKATRASQVRELTDEELEEREKRRVRAGAHEQVMAGMGRDLMFAGRAVPDWRRAMSGVM